ncbi:MAG TPA: hypothetical protein PLB05_04555 [Candidatus Omnitrophota bacterium]|jgi:hypothetical protein|nr:hypothetical protein [Candidatus Omnitrophota bacterium]HPN55722.1 hypothetical protein [Candidatus Omnitrophota bacterium]
MEENMKSRIKTAEIISLSFLAFFILLCLLELFVYQVMHIAFILCTGVLFFSSAAVFGIDERNLKWQVSVWSGTMKIFMLLFFVFVTIISADLLNVAQETQSGRLNIKAIHASWRARR